MAGRQRHELFQVPAVEGTGDEQDRSNTLLQKNGEGRFEVAIGSGIHNKELQAQRAGSCLQVYDVGLDTRIGRVGKNAEHDSIGHQLAEQLQSFRPQFGR